MNRSLGTIFLFVWLFSACSPKQPSDVLSPTRMEDILIDYHLAQGVYEVEEGGEETRYKLLQSVFKKHHITEAQFDSSMVWYSTNSEKLMEIYARVDQRIQARISMTSSTVNKSDDKFSNLSTEGDTCNVWSLPTHFALQPAKLQYVYKFSLPADSTCLAGDHYLWHFTTELIKENQVYVNAYAHLTLIFEGDTTVSSTKLINYTGDIEISLPTHKGTDSLQLKCIQGFIYVTTTKSTNNNEFALLLIRNIALIRMHINNDSDMDAEEPVEDITEIDSTEESNIVDDAHIREDVRLTPIQRRDAKPHRSLQNIQKVRPVRISTQPRKQVPRKLKR